MTANEGEYPKTDGDIFYGKDSNMSYFQGALASTMNYAAVSVGNTATSIKATNASRKAMIMKNNGAQSIFIGPANTVTTANGYELAAGKSIYIRDTTALYGIVASSTCDLRYMEVQ